jgi:TolB protein
MKIVLRFILSVLSLCALSVIANAQMQIEITGVGQSQYPIAVTRFLNESSLPSYVTDVVRSNTASNGSFVNLERGETEVAENAIPDFTMWGSRRAQALAIGTVTALPGGL